MQFYKISDGTMPNVDEIRQQNPGIGIPDEPDDLLDLGYMPLVLTSKPAAPAGQRAVPDGGEILNGVYHIKWAIGPFTADELQEARAAKWEAIKAERDRRKDGGILVSGHWFHSDTASRIQWLGLKDQGRDVLASGGNQQTILQKLGQNVMWKPMDSDIRLATTVQLSFDVVTAVGNLDAVLFFVAEQHKAAMIASASPHLYDFSTGWPDRFEG